MSTCFLCGVGRMRAGSEHGPFAAKRGVNCDRGRGEDKDKDEDEGLHDSS
jgi:hypothetical protein